MAQRLADVRAFAVSSFLLAPRLLDCGHALEFATTAPPAKFGVPESWLGDVQTTGRELSDGSPPPLNAVGSALAALLNDRFNSLDQEARREWFVEIRGTTRF
jgi:hypothetical protein